MTQDFGQAARYHQAVIALRVPSCLSLGIATVLTSGLFLLPAPPPPSSPHVPITTPREPLPTQWESAAPACDPAAVTAVVIRGQFTSRRHLDEGFAISFAGAQGRYTAMTDRRGYFEVRIPREDFDGDVCALPLAKRDFADEQMTLEYRIDVEH